MVDNEVENESPYWDYYFCGKMISHKLHHSSIGNIDGFPLIRCLGLDGSIFTII